MPTQLAIPPPSTSQNALGDSGTTTNLVRQSSSQILHNVCPNSEILVGLPNGQSIQSTHSGDLLPTTTGYSLPAYVFADKDLQENLASLSSITNIGCSIVLTSTAIDITLNDERVYHGYKRPHDTLWIIDLDKLQAGFIDRPHTANVAIQLDLDADFVAFMHATLGSPPTSSFLKAARKGWLNRIPRLTANMIAANPPNSVATAMGHLDQTRQVKRPRKRAQGEADFRAHDRPHYRRRRPHR